VWSKNKVNFSFKLCWYYEIIKLFFLWFGSTVFDIYAEFHVNIFNCCRVTRVFVNIQKWIFRFLSCLILLNNEFALNFVCEMNILPGKRCRRPLVMRLCRKKMFTSGTKTSKKAENEFKTNSVPDDHQHLPMKATSRKSKIWCSKIVDWQLETLLMLWAFHLDQPKPF